MLAGVLADAQVDLNPHQIEAAQFAIRTAAADESVTRRKAGRSEPAMIALHGD
jgi:hypothetical protein